MKWHRIGVELADKAGKTERPHVIISGRAGGMHQQTQYVYNVTTGAGGSAINSNDVLGSAFLAGQARRRRFVQRALVMHVAEQIHVGGDVAQHALAAIGTVAADYE